MTFNSNITGIQYPTEQSFLNVSSTFDMILPENDDNEEIVTPLSSILGEKAPAVAFTLNLFKLRPELFGIYATSLIYAQYSGTAYKPETVYGIFEMFLRRSDKAYITARRTRKLMPYEFDPDLLITWARVMQNTKTNVIFEPVMSNLSKVMNVWLNNRKVRYGGIEYDINTFKPLCYTRSGECFISLLPYICYICTFLIHCRPFTFNEAQTESSTYGFYKSLNDYYQLNYTALGEDYGINVIKSSLDELRKIPDKYFSDMFKVMLHPDKIIQIRNREMEKTPELLNESISDQNGLSIEFVKNAWDTTMSQLIKRVVSLSPIKTIFDSIPRFRRDNNLNVYELMMWTQYCLAGGDKPFCIDPEINTRIKGFQSNYSFMFHADPSAIKPLPSTVFGTQYIKSDIKTLTIAKGLPFCSNDLILEMATSYLFKNFDAKRNDMLDSEPIGIDESMLRNDKLFDKPLSILIKDLFVNGLWMYENNSMSTVLNILLENETFAEEITDILSLASVTQIVYDNRLASTIITTYILSYLDEWILSTCNNNYPLKFFSPYSYLVSLQPSSKRIAKLLDMTISMLYIGNINYTRFVNEKMKVFQDMMILNPIIQQPYVKGLADMADIYAIGGCDLYNYAKYANPLIRGYGWITNVYGNCEQLETFYHWIQPLINNSLMELLEQLLTNVSSIETNLKIQWVKMYTNKQYPNILANYTFSSSNYKFKNYPYALDLQTSDGKSIISLVCSKAFPRSYASQATEQSIIFKPITFSKNKVTAGVSVTNGMNVNGVITPARLSETGLSMFIPIYNFEGRMEDVKVIYTSPSSHRIEILTLFNSRYRQNQTMFVFTSMPVRTRFQNYLTDDGDSSPADSMSSMTDRINPRNSSIKL